MNCLPAGEAVELSLIWDAVTLMWRHYDKPCIVGLVPWSDALDQQFSNELHGQESYNI